jgi:hypothetical protein
MRLSSDKTAGHLTPDHVRYQYFRGRFAWYDVIITTHPVTVATFRHSDKIVFDVVKTVGIRFITAISRLTYIVEH